MSKIETCQPRRHLVTALVLALGGMLLAAGPAGAQQPGPIPRFPSEARGYQKMKILQQFLLNREAAATHAAHRVGSPAVTARPASTLNPQTQVPLSLVFAIPEPSPVTETVAIQGPNGEVRNFPVEGGLATVRVRPVVVHPGETVTIRFTPPEPRP